jgi:RNA-splicing ligase RtcB
MAEPILLTLGSDQSKYLSFSPHGAGRNKSRRTVLNRYTKSKKTGFDQKLLAQDLAKATEGLEVRWYQGRPDITETPIGYKPAATVRQQLETYNLANVIAEIQPLGSIMSGRAEIYEKPLTPKQLRQLQHRKTRRKMNNKDWLSDDSD